MASSHNGFFRTAVDAFEWKIRAESGCERFVLYPPFNALHDIHGGVPFDAMRRVTFSTGHTAGDFAFPTADRVRVLEKCEMADSSTGSPTVQNDNRA